MDATPASARRRPKNRPERVLALLRAVTGLVTPVALSLAVVLTQPVIAGYAPPKGDLHVGYRASPEQPLR
jgi:hypothetical protein